MNKHLFDHLMRAHHLRSDADLSRKLKMNQGNISHMRKGKRVIPAGTILKIYDVFGMSIESIREMISRESTTSD